MNMVYLLARVAFGLIFIYASFDKLLNPAAFAEIIFNYKLLPEFAVNAVALFLPMLEMVCGVALIAGVLPVGAAGLMNLLMVVFIIALGLNWARGLDVACGCFSTAADGKSDPAMRLLEDLIMLAIGITAYVGAVRGRGGWRSLAGKK